MGRNLNILQKLENGVRLEASDALLLYDLELFELGKFAFKKRSELYKNKVFFNSNRHINPTNICADVCKFCAFSAHRKNPNPYKMSHDEVMKVVDESVQNGADEIHIVSAHNADSSWQWYLGIFKKIKEKYPNLHVKAMTAAEVDFISRKFQMSYDEVIDKMLEYGVDSMPGGGAEIFDESVRAKICKGKVSSGNWLKIHEKWHKKGKFSNATMLFGHIESREHRIDHMLRIRTLQDQTHGFNAFIPLVYQRENNYLKDVKILGSVEILKTIAISRLVLDNVAHIKAYWATSTLNLAMIAQEFGADDLDGTIQKESIQSAAGAASANGVSLKDFCDLIKSSGYVPVLRDSLYNELKIY